MTEYAGVEPAEDSQAGTDEQESPPDITGVIRMTMPEME